MNRVSWHTVCFLQNLFLRWFWWPSSLNQLGKSLLMVHQLEKDQEVNVIDHKNMGEMWRAISMSSTSFLSVSSCSKVTTVSPTVCKKWCDLTAAAIDHKNEVSWGRWSVRRFSSLLNIALLIRSDERIQMSSEARYSSECNSLLYQKKYIWVCLS